MHVSFRQSIAGILVLFLGGFFSSLRGKEVVVNPGQSIAAALATMAPGDTLLIKNGIYREAIKGFMIPSGTATNPTIIRGESRAAILRPNQSVSDTGCGNCIIHMRDKSRIIISTLTLDGVDWVGSAGIGFSTAGSIGNSHVRVENCRIMFTGKNSGGGVGAIGGVGSGSGSSDNHHFEYVGNEIGPHGSTNFDHGIYQRAREILAEGNLIHDILGYGIRTDRPSSGIPASNCIFRNNQILRCHGGINVGGGDNSQAHTNQISDVGIGILVGNGGPSNSKVFNNSILRTQNQDIFVNTGTSGTVVENNCVDPAKITNLVPSTILRNNCPTCCSASSIPPPTNVDVTQTQLPTTQMPPAGQSPVYQAPPPTSQLPSSSTNQVAVPMLVAGVLVAALLLEGD